MDYIAKSQFSDYFNGLSYDDVLGRLSRHLSADLHYEAQVVPLAQGRLHLLFRGFAGGANGLLAVHYQQTICPQSGAALHGDMTIDRNLQQNHIGTYLSYNNLLLRRDLGLRHAFFTAEFMGAYAWARMGALVDVTTTDNLRAVKLARNLGMIRDDLSYLRGRLGLPAVEIDYSQPDCLWKITDMKTSGFMGHDGFFKDSVPADFEWEADRDTRLTGKVASMVAQYATNPQSITVGQLALFDRLIPSYYLLQEENDLAARQWERIRHYMRTKGYPDLQPE